MSDEHLPRLFPRRLAPRAEIAGAFLDGEPDVVRLFTPSPGPVPRPARLPAAAFTGGSPSVRRKLEKILKGEGVLVTTGQQPVLFLGPLFVLYKAMTAIAEAEKVESETGLPALAAFWVASDDHDWAEVASCTVLDRNGGTRTLTVPPAPDRVSRAVGASPLEPEVSGILDELASILGQTEFTDDVLSPLRESYRPGARFGEAFSGALSALLAGRQIVLLDSSGPLVREAAAPFLQRAIEIAPLLASSLDEGRRLVEAAGHEPTLRPPVGGTQVFLDTPGGRRHLLADGATLRVGTDGERISARTVSDMLEREPQRFSPAAALRPALESWLLPVGRTVLGPGEIAYWAQLGPVFEAVEVRLPVVRPRGAWTVVEERIGSVLEMVGADPIGLADGGEALERALVARNRPRETERALEALRARLGEGLAAAESAAAQEVPGLRSAIGKARAGLFGALSELQRVIDARVREREEVEIARVRKAARQLFPDGRPQERRQSPFYYLARYGPGFLDLVDAAASVAVVEDAS